MNFLEHNSLYVVGIISAVIWLGLWAFMYSIEKRLRKLEEESKTTQVDIPDTSPGPRRMP